MKKEQTRRSFLTSLGALATCLFVPKIIFGNNKNNIFAEDYVTKFIRENQHLNFKEFADKIAPSMFPENSNEASLIGSLNSSIISSTISVDKGFVFFVEYNDNSKTNLLKNRFVCWAKNSNCKINDLLSENIDYIARKTTRSENFADIKQNLKPNNYVICNKTLANMFNGFVDIKVNNKLDDSTMIVGEKLESSSNLLIPIKAYGIYC